MFDAYVGFTSSEYKVHPSCDSLTGVIWMLENGIGAVSVGFLISQSDSIEAASHQLQCGMTWDSVFPLPSWLGL